MEEVKEKSIVTSYRLNPETKDRLQQQLKELGVTQEQYFNKVVSIMELENVKQNSFLSKDTTIIQSNLDAILNAFVSVAESSNNLIGNKDKELLESNKKYKDMLADKESCITLQKQELQEVYNNLIVVQNENKEHESELLNIKNEHDKHFDQLESNMKDKNLIVEEYKNKNDMLLSNLAEHKQYKTEVELYKNKLQEQQTKNIDKENSIKDKDYNIKQLKNDMEKMKQESQKELDQLKKESELNIKLAVAEIKEELNNKLSKEQQKYNSEIEQYQVKYKFLLEELEQKSTTQNSKKESPAPKDKQ
jgi:hypothetical protein